MSERSPRPVPVIGDTTSAAERAREPDGWRFAADARRSLYDVMAARRDVRRFRPDPLPDDVLERILTAGHQAPSVGHCQPWRFILVTDADARERAALMADRERLAQAAELSPDAGRHLLDLQLEGIRQAPLGVVVCCDRRIPAAGVLGRRTFPDADLWSCACAIENIWLAARAEGVGVGWVTLFRPEELAALVHLPEGVEPLGWLCLGWPDERNPSPGLERAGWSQRLPLHDVVLRERWPIDADAGPDAPVSRLRSPSPDAVVGATDRADEVLSAPGALGVLDRVVDRVVAMGAADTTGGALVIAVGRHPVAGLGVSAYEPRVTDDVLAAAVDGDAIGAVAATRAGLAVVVVDGGSSLGNLRDTDALPLARVEELVAQGEAIGEERGAEGLVALGEVGIGNTTVAAALAAYLLDLEPRATVGLGTGVDAAMLERKRAVVAAAVARARAEEPAPTRRPLEAVARLGGPEVALLAGVARGTARAGAPVVLDGLITSVAAYVAVLLEPAVAAYLVAGQRSREVAHEHVLAALGLEPLLDLRIRAGEGAGAALASGIVLDGLAIRKHAARTAPRLSTS